MASAQSTKVALGLQKYLKPIPRPYNRKISEQMSEYYGLGSFHCSEHETLALTQDENLIQAQLIRRKTKTSIR